MKKKATTRKVIVKNSAFLAAMRASFSERAARHQKIVEQVKSSGILDTLGNAGKNNSSNDIR